MTQTDFDRLLVKIENDLNAAGILPHEVEWVLATLTREFRGNTE